MTEPGRNQPCSCKSGKKYKKCCGVDAPAASRGAISRATLLGSGSEILGPEGLFSETSEATRRVGAAYGEAILAQQAALNRLENLMRRQEMSAARDPEVTFDVLVEPDHPRRAGVVESLALTPVSDRFLTQQAADYVMTTRRFFASDMRDAAELGEQSIGETIAMMSRIKLIADYLNLAVRDAFEDVKAGNPPTWPEEEWAEEVAALEAEGRLIAS